MEISDCRFAHYLFRVLSDKSAIDLVTNDVGIYDLAAEKFKSAVQQEIECENKLRREYADT